MCPIMYKPHSNINTNNRMYAHTQISRISPRVYHYIYSIVTAVLYIAYDGSPYDGSPYGYYVSLNIVRTEE